MPPAVVAAGIGAVGAIGGGLIASSGASSAARAQQQSDAQAIAEQRRQFDLNRSDFAPYLSAGKMALPQIEDLLGVNGNAKAQAAIDALKSSPAYQSLFSNGQETLLQNASATGGLRGGNTQGALADFGRDTLSQTISNRLAQLGGLAGLGENATGAVAGLGSNSADSISSLLRSSGAAQAGNATAQAGIWSGALNNIMPLILKAINPSASSGTGTIGF